MKKVYIFIVLILAIGSIFYFSQTNNKDEVADVTSGGNEISLSFQFSEEEVQTTKFQFKETLDLIQIVENISQDKAWEYKSEDYGDMGILITQIRDKQNGQDQKYWQYFVDDEQPQISADKYFPKNNTHIEWKFQKSEF